MLTDTMKDSDKCSVSIDFDNVDVWNEFKIDCIGAPSFSPSAVQSSNKPSNKPSNPRSRFRVSFIATFYAADTPAFIDADGRVANRYSVQSLRLF